MRPVRRTVFFVRSLISRVITLEHTHHDDDDEAGEQYNQHNAVHDGQPMNLELRRCEKRGEKKELVKALQ